MPRDNDCTKWVRRQNETKEQISFDEEILDYEKETRGVYGIFLEEECVYVGRSIDIHDRFFNRSSGHIARLMERRHHIDRLNYAIEDDKRINIRLLKEVPFLFDEYSKDLQRLASAENHYIDHYQALDQCLSQFPEGSWLTEKSWKERARKSQQ